MSVVAAAVAAGAAAYVPHQQLCGSGARKRKDLQDLDEEEVEIGRRRHQQHRHGLFVLERVDEEERSSIGAASDGEEEGGDDDEADSASSTTRRRKQDALACMDALDDALPIKRGLSNFFSGKSRSFANLQDATAQDLAKPENPFNKRRRVLRCSSIRRVASTSLTALPPFLNNTSDDATSSG